MDGTQEPVACAKTSQENPEISAAVVEEKTSPENSEYDSVDSYSDEEQDARSKPRLGSHSETEGSVTLEIEREEGDGQESVPSKKVDDDEDKKNPQYIPKRGTFYEHDDRTAEDLEKQEEADAEKPKEDPKKKVWEDKKERWSHDKFNDQEQAPKSRSELVSIYGYDIRNEDGPPRARRRRRYGRGPNKYTRNWEDEEAYTKPPAVTARPQKPMRKQTRPENRNTEEYPPLGGEGRNNRTRNKSRSSDSNQEDSHTYRENEENDQSNRRSFERQAPRKDFNKNVDQTPKQGSYSNQSIERQESNKSGSYQQNRLNQPARVGTGRVMTPKREIKDSDYKGFTTKMRQTRVVKSEQQKVLPPRKKDDFIQSQNFTNKSNSTQHRVDEIENDMVGLNIQDGVYKGVKQHGGGNGGNNNQNRQGSVPPRLQQSEQKGSKRYSSIRQRSLPESGTPPGVNFSFYPSDYNSTAPPPATQQPLLPPIPPPALVPTQVPVSAAPPPLLQAPFPPAAAFAGPPPPQAYLQAGPPSFIAAPPTQPQIVSFVTQAQPAFVPGFQGQFTPVNVTQPTDLFQPQGGITYYSTDQQVIPRAVPQKRPKAAIPIVAPTDFKENREQDNGKNSKGDINREENANDTLGNGGGNLDTKQEQE